MDLADYSKSPQGAPAKPIAQDVQAIAEEEPIPDGLLGNIRTDWRKAATGRLFQEQQIFVRALLNSRAYYNPSLIPDETQAQVFVNATRPKIQTAVALLMPVVLGPGMSIFTIGPEPDACDPGEAMALLAKGMSPNEIRDQMFQDAGRKADRLTNKVSKGFDYTCLRDKMLRYLWDMSLFGTGILMGPLPEANPEAQTSPKGDAGLLQKLIDAGLLDKYLPCCEVVCPLDFYPDPCSYTIEGMRFAIWRMVLGKAQIQAMLDDPSFRKDAVEKALADHPAGFWTPQYWETTINSLNKKVNQFGPEGRYEVLNWWGWVNGKDLNTMGAPIPEKRWNEQVIANVWVLGDAILKIVIPELHQKRLPFYVTPYSYAPNTLWGIGPAEMMFDAQDAINGCERAILANMALCSGPQLVVDLEQLADPTQVLEQAPRKIWAVKGKVGIQTKPIDFFVPDCNLPQIMSVQQNEERLAQEQTALPNFLQGINSEGTHNRTAEGANLQFNMSITPLKTVVYNIENNLIVPLVNQFIAFFQRYSNDPDIKGRFQVQVHGVKGLLARESFTQAMNDLLQNLGNLPNEVGWLKMHNWFNAYLRNSNLVNEDLVYTPEEKAKNDQQAMLLQQQTAEQEAIRQSQIAATPKLRAEITPKDALMEFIKTAPKDTDIQRLLLQEGLQVFGFMTPDLQEAFKAANQLTHFQQMNEAHSLAHGMGAREYEAAQTINPPIPATQGTPE